MEQPHVITLGTAGGPRVWTPQDGSEPRCGIATAVVVGERWYLIDCGQGVYRQIMKAGLDIKKLAGIFVTHLHSDHVVDLNNVLLLAFPNFGNLGIQVPIYGPGDRGALPPVNKQATGPVHPVYPERPTPGITDFVDLVLRAHATDINDRVLDSLRPSPLDIWRPSDIILPADTGYHPNDNPSPDMAPFVIHEDDHVKVTATLVIHPPIAPAFAFRFDTEAGSVTISGDTRFSENLRTLAEGTDLLLHEAIDFDWVHRFNDARTDTGRAVIEHHQKSHSSPEDAATLAEQAGVKQLALHHLVPGTAPAAVWEAASTVFQGELHIPADNEKLSLKGRVAVGHR